MRRLLAVLISLMLLVAALPAHAQLGGLKKKVADKVAGKKPDTTVATSASGKPKCDKSTMLINADVVNRYLKGIAARDAELRKMSKEPGKIGEYYAATFKRQEVAQRKREFDLRRGPDWERYKVIYPKMIKGDQAATRENSALADSLDPNKIQTPELEWEAQAKGNARLDSVMMSAAGIPVCDWGGNGIGDRIPMLVNILVNEPDAKDFRGYGTPAEGAAVKARLKELADGLGYNTNRASSTYTEAEKAHIKEEDEKLQRLAVLTGDPYTDCATGVQQAFMKKHQAEFDKLQKQQDMAASQKLSMELMQETDKECKKYSKNKDDE